MVTARIVALQTLLDVERKGAYANLALDKRLSRPSAGQPLDRRERAQATQLVYGVLRNRTSLDWKLAHFCNTPVDDLPLPILLILRLASFELRMGIDVDHASRPSTIPVAQICHTYVELAKQFGHRGTASLVNAVLRKVATDGATVPWPPRDQQPVLHLATLYSHPEWLVERWLKRWGFEATERLCETNNTPAPVCLRVNTLRSSVNDVMQLLADAGVGAQETRWSPVNLRLGEMANIASLPGFQEGLFTVQDEGSTLVGSVVAPLPGELVLDACAGPGGKSTHLAELMNDQGKLVAMELHPHRARLIQESCRRLALTCVQVQTGDFREIAMRCAGQADRCLVDAPCSGTGVLRRRPDARWRKRPEQITELARLQSKLLESAAATLKPGGMLIYSTCSLEPEENEGVVRQFAQKHREFALENAWDWLPADLPKGSEAWARLLPHVHGTDGMFIARLKRLW